MHQWKSFVQKIEKDLGSATVEKWLSSLKIDHFDARNLYLKEDDPLKKAWFEEHIRPRLNQFVDENERPIKVHFVENSPKGSKETGNSLSFSIQEDPLDPDFNFESFLETDESRIIVKLLKETDSLSFNPIFIYGEKSSGKTHLLQAAALYLRSKKKKVLFATAASFTSHVVQAIRLGKMKDFRAVYRNIDALIIDNINELAERAATQEEFFHTFNALQTVGKQIILSSSKAPSKLEGIEARLISRFEWGISLKLSSISKRELLENKNHSWKLELSEEMIDFLFSTFEKDPLSALQSLCLREKNLKDLTPEKASFLLRDLIKKKQTKEITFDAILKATSKQYDVSPKDLLGKSQLKDVAYPRQVAMFLVRNHLKLPFQKMGKAFGRDHSTVMSSVKRIQKEKDEKSKDLLDSLQEIEKALL